MTIDWINFTPWQSLAGGQLIGLAASWLLLVNGRIAGISGIVGRLLQPRAGEIAWRLAFLIGLLLATPLVLLVAPSLAPAHDLSVAPRAGWGTVILAGLLVGFGTRLGNGCTSGHGICGLAHLSRRSLAAVLTFMANGAATVFISRHVLGA
ncbi:MAG TPA: YeeE/YedE family protein [Azospira sp.]|nr:YeeE/YedE family protein [Azospira sp.]